MTVVWIAVCFAALIALSVLFGTGACLLGAAAAFGGYALAVVDEARRA